MIMKKTYILALFALSNVTCTLFGMERTDTVALKKTKDKRALSAPQRDMAVPRALEAANKDDVTVDESSAQTKKKKTSQSEVVVAPRNLIAPPAPVAQNSTTNLDAALPRASCTQNDINQFLSNLANEADVHKTLIIVREWLDKGYSIEVKSSNGMTPMYIAAGRGLLPLAQLLHQKGANLESEFNSNKPLIYAAAKGHLPLVRFFCEVTDQLDAQNSDGETALFHAVYNNYVDVIRFLLDQGADPNVHRKNGDTPLMIAAWRGYVGKTVELLCERKANVNAVNQSGQTAFLYACRFNHLPTAQLLYDNKAATNTEDNDGHTALLLAAYNSALPLLQFLLCDKKCNINDSNNGGWTALMSSIISPYPHLPTIQFLCDQGADITRALPNGATALSIAKNSGRAEIVAYLVQQYHEKGIPLPANSIASGVVAPQNVTNTLRPPEPGNQPSGALPALKPSAQPLTIPISKPPAAPAVAQQDVSANETNMPLIFTRMVALAASLAERGNMQPLIEVGTCYRKAFAHIFAQFFNENRKEHMIAVLPFVDLKSLHSLTGLAGKTLIIEALQKDKLDCAKALIASGQVDVDAQNNKGQTALMIATEKAGNNPEFLAMILLLKKANACKTIKDAEGRIFLDYASPEIMEFLEGWASDVKHLMKGKTT